MTVRPPTAGLRREQVLAVRCPSCEAEPGEACRRRHRDGDTYRMAMHKDRWDWARLTIRRQR